MGWLHISKKDKIDITYLGWLGENLTWSSKLLRIRTWHRIYNILIDAWSRQWGVEGDNFNTTIPVDLKKIHAILITHAHMDHIGKIPLYVRHGYKGPIYMTPVTSPILFEALKDEQKIFQRILEEKKEVLTKIKKAFNAIKSHNARTHEWWVKIKKLDEQKKKAAATKHSSNQNLLNRHNISSIQDIKKLEQTVHTMDEEKEQNEQDLWNIISLIKTTPYNKPVTIIPKVAEATFYNAWHIEGSAQIDIEVAKNKLLFSGDLWRIRDNAIIGKPSMPKKKWYSFVSLESTYAWKVHQEREEANKDLYYEISHTHWPILMPCFSLQRIPEVLLTLLEWQDELTESQETSTRISKKEDIKPRTIDTIYVDSPLGKKYKEIFMKELGTKYAYLNTSNIKFISVAEREELLLKIRKGYRVLILSSSGMLQWWTVMHYLPEILKQAKAKIIFSWFPGKNTLASQIVDGNRKVVITGAVHDVNCNSVYIEWFSSHADHNELVHYHDSISKTKWAKVVLEHGWINRHILAADIKNPATKVIVPQEWDSISIL